MEDFCQLNEEKDKAQCALTEKVNSRLEEAEET